MTPTDPEGDDLVPLSALNALLYCDRRAALRHLDGLYVHNEHTLRGDRLHARADTPGVERRKASAPSAGSGSPRDASASTAAPTSSSSTAPPAPAAEAPPSSRFPSPSSTNAAANAAGTTTTSSSAPRPSASKKCSPSPSPEAPSTTKKASPAETSNSPPTLRAETESAVARLHSLLESNHVPPAVLKPQCRGCSLRAHCLPDVFSHSTRVETFLRNLFNPIPLRLTDPTPNLPTSHDQFPPQSR